MNVNIILFICRQNVGRSQMAAGFMCARAKNSPHIRVQSAGFEDIKLMQQKYNDRPHPQVIAMMKEKGIDISDQHITQLSEKLLQQADKIIVLADENELPGYAEPFKAKMNFMPMDDPAKGTQSVIPQIDASSLRQTRDEIERIVSDITV